MRVFYRPSTLLKDERLIYANAYAIKFKFQLLFFINIWYQFCNISNSYLNVKVCK